MHPKYKRMLKLMQAKEDALLRKRKRRSRRNGKPTSRSGQRRAPQQKTQKWFLYILRCSDGSFYTGVTNDLQRRFSMHEKGTASRYTRSRRPVELLYHETLSSRTQALVRECAVKALSRDNKEKLIGQRNGGESQPA